MKATVSAKEGRERILGDKGVKGVFNDTIIIQSVGLLSNNTIII